MSEMQLTWDPRTRPSLLGRLAVVPSDSDAWAEFVSRYGQLMYRWCRRWHLQPADAEDVTQGVLLDVARGMKNFQYDPGRSFRAWLKTLTHRAWCDWLTARRRQPAAGGDALALATNTASRDELHDLLESEHRRVIFEMAAARVRMQIKPATWEAFRLIAIEGRPGAEVASRLGVSVGAVYIARHKVQQLLLTEADKLAARD